MASSLRAPRLESMSSAFIKSTIDVRHCSFSFLSATALSRTGAISMACAGVEAGLPPPLAGAAGAVAAPGAASLGTEDCAHDLAKNAHMLLPGFEGFLTPLGVSRYIQTGRVGAVSNLPRNSPRTGDCGVLGAGGLM